MPEQLVGRPRELSGKEIQQQMIGWLTGEVATFKAETNVRPEVVIFQIGKSNEASNAYVSKKKQVGEEIGIGVTVIERPEETPLSDIIGEYRDRQSDPRYHGFMFQRPFPGPLEAHRYRILDEIDPRKDVDGLTSTSLGKLSQRRKDGFAPATANANITILDAHGIPIKGSHIVVAGRSDIVGEPTRAEVQDRGATVSVIHTDTDEAEAQHITRRADIVIVAVGKPRKFTAEYFREGQVVIDDGTHHVPGTKNKFVGDVDYDWRLPEPDAVARTLGPSGAITPVPKGPGAVTIGELFVNVLNATRLQHGKERVLFKFKRAA